MSKITKTIAALGVVASLGVAALPLSSYAAESQPVKLTATIDSNIAISAADTAVDLGTILAGGDVATGTTRVTVSTNSIKGYTLTMKGANSNTNMINTAGGDAVIAAGNPAKSTSAWGVSVDGGSSWKNISAGPVELYASTVDESTSTTEKTGVTDVTFGVTAESGQDAGTYETSVVFVAAEKNA